MWPFRCYERDNLHTIVSLSIVSWSIASMSNTVIIQQIPKCFYIVLLCQCGVSVPTCAYVDFLLLFTCTEQWYFAYAKNTHNETWCRKRVPSSAYLIENNQWRFCAGQQVETPNNVHSQVLYNVSCPGESVCGWRRKEFKSSLQLRQRSGVFPSKIQTYIHTFTKQQIGVMLPSRREGDIGQRIKPDKYHYVSLISYDKTKKINYYGIITSFYIYIKHLKTLKPHLSILPGCNCCL